jgi:sulfate/thiosulfate transport system substrate-binding protein
MLFMHHLARSLARAVVSAALMLPVSVAVHAETTLLNVSYDVSRELYKAINPAFVAHWMAKTGEAVRVNQSHGGSSVQALAVIAGLDADVITMSQPSDIDILAERGGLVAADWRERFPYGATPYTTTSVFLVRKNNPKHFAEGGIYDQIAVARR